MIRAIALAAIAAALLATPAGAVQAGPPYSVKECVQVVKKSPPLKGSTLAATVFCLRPSAIRTNATVTWTTCPTTPKGQGEGCAEGTFGVTFRSRGGIDLNRDVDSWGGESVPGAGIFSLPGMGRYSCTATYLDRDSGLKHSPYKKSVAVRDQGVGFAAVGTRIKVGWSVHPGERGPLGYNVDVKLGQPNTCIVGMGKTVEHLRAVWPGKTISTAAIQGKKTTITSSGKSSYSVPLPESEGFLPGVKLQATVRWTASTTIVSSLLKKI